MLDLAMTRMAFLLASLLITSSSFAAPPAQTATEALHSLLQAHWEDYLAENPENAVLAGDRRRAAAVREESEEGVQRRLRRTAGFLAAFRAIDANELATDDRLSLSVMIHLLELELDESRFRPWEMPLSHLAGAHVEAPILATLYLFDDVDDYRYYARRLEKLPLRFEQIVARMRAGVQRGVVQPVITVEKMINQVERVASLQPEATPFVQVVERRPPTMSEEQAHHLRQELVDVVATAVLPAYRALGVFLREEYLPNARTEPGMWALPDGDEWYALMVRKTTTSRLTPEEIHQRGLREVASIQMQMLVLAQRLGAESIPQLNAWLGTRRDLRFSSPEELLASYRKYIDQIEPRLPRLFHRLPEGEIEVVAVESYREAEAPGAQYIAASPDGTRPARMVVNTGGKGWNRIGVGATAFHEAMPGHHLQVALSQELPIPPFRKRTFGAYSEGWALYAERLGKELGMFRDPISEYGRLQTEMIRAIRLVVDTGINSRQWDTVQAEAYFRRYSMMGAAGIDSEIGRYVAMPGQALGYKIGELTILDLRKRARRQLGRRFDIRDFHDAWLGAGALPLDLAVERVEAWIEATRAPEARRTIPADSAAIRRLPEIGRSRAAGQAP
jgi:uncharacterized protein (DUF885 family)